MTDMEHAIEHATRVIGDLPGFNDAQVRGIAEDLAGAGLLAPVPLRDRLGGSMTTVYRAYSPTLNKAGATFADYARAQSLAAVRNQFAATDLDAGLPADWIVQTGHVQWENP